MPAVDLREEYVPPCQASEWQQSLEIELFTLGSIYTCAEESNSREFCSSQFPLQKTLILQIAGKLSGSLS